MSITKHYSGIYLDILYPGTENKTEPLLDVAMLVAVAVCRCQNCWKWSVLF